MVRGYCSMLVALVFAGFVATPIVTFAQEGIPPKLANMDRFVGVWNGHSVVEVPGQAVYTERGYHIVAKVAKGWGYTTVGHWAESKDSTLEESFLSSYDALRDALVWSGFYSTTPVGPLTFRAIGTWLDDDRLKLEGEPISLPDGSTLVFNGLWTFLSPTHRKLVSTSSIDGIVVQTVTIEMHKLF